MHEASRIPGDRQRVQWAYQAVLGALQELNRAAAELPPLHPAHQEIDEAALAARVALDAVRPK